MYPKEEQSKSQHKSSATCHMLLSLKRHKEFSTCTSWIAATTSNPPHLHHTWDDLQIQGALLRGHPSPPMAKGLGIHTGLKRHKNQSPNRHIG